METELRALELGNVTEGRLDARFRELLQEIYPELQAAGRYQTATDGSVTHVVDLTIRIRHWPALGGDPPRTEITAGAERKPPKRKLALQTAYTTSGEVVVQEHEPQQTDLLESSPHGQKGTA